MTCFACGLMKVERLGEHPRGGIGTITRGYPALSVAFYKAMAEGGFLPDELGFSFYPSSSSRPPQRLQAFQKTMQEVRRELDRPVFIAEFGYPSGELHEGMFADWNHPLEKYPLTKEGQAAVLKDLAAHYGYDPMDVSYNRLFRNPALSYLSAERLLIMYSQGGTALVTTELDLLRSHGILYGGFAA